MEKIVYNTVEEYHETSAAVFENSKDLSVVGARQFVKWVQFSSECGVTAENTLLSLSNEPGKGLESTECAFTGDVWECKGGETTAFRYITFENKTPTNVTDNYMLEISSCVVSAYATLFEYCGDAKGVNPFSGRFYDVEAFRSLAKTLDLANQTWKCFALEQ